MKTRLSEITDRLEAFTSEPAGTREKTIALRVLEGNAVSDVAFLLALAQRQEALIGWHEDLFRLLHTDVNTMLDAGHTVQQQVSDVLDEGDADVPHCDLGGFTLAEEV